MNSTSAVYDTRLLKHIRRKLRVDAISVARPATTTNGEGDPDGRTSVLSGFGTFTDARANPMIMASQRGTVIDKILRLELGLDVRAGDFVTLTATGDVFEVIEADNLRLYRRALLRVAT